jgi:hypothetical protein
MLRQGASPLRPQIVLDTGRPSHGSRDREGADSVAQIRVVTFSICGKVEFLTR